MNIAILIGRLVRDPELRYSTGDKPIAIARYTLAVDRVKKDEADFINCIAFDKAAEFADKYFTKGLKIAVRGHILTGSYKNKEGNTVYTTEVVIDSQEFVERAEANQENKKEKSIEKLNNNGSHEETSESGFMDIPDGLEDEGLPFN